MLCRRIWRRSHGARGKSIAILVALLGMCLFAFVWMRTLRLSMLRDLEESRSEELSRELRRLPIVEESEDRWRRLSGASHVIILSAYLDTRPEVVLEEDEDLRGPDTAWAMIRIIAILPVTMEKSLLFCSYRYRYVDGTPERTIVRRSIGTRLSAFKENFGMSFSAAYVLCELPDVHSSEDRISLPWGITITSEAPEDPNRLEENDFVVVRYAKRLLNASNDSDDGIAVCVQPLHHRFAQAIDLASFVEFYRMMGVTRFTFYKDSVDSRVNELLNYYSRSGVATVVRWELPGYIFYERNLRVDGIFAALNDCMYRSSFHNSYRYVAGVDVDEYIVPRRHENLKQLMNELNPPGSENFIGAWIFRNIFFYLMHPDDPVTLRPDLPKLKVHSKTSRWSKSNPVWDRSKFIVQARDVIDLGNHRVWKLKKMWSVFGRRYKEVGVDPETAGSHHYRTCETLIEKCWKRETIVDKTTHRFTSRLAERVGTVLKIVFPSEKSAPTE